MLLRRLKLRKRLKAALCFQVKLRKSHRLAEVLAVGPGGYVDGKEVKMEVKVGDRVIFPKYSGTEIKIDGEELTIIEQSKLLAIIE